MTTPVSYNVALPVKMTASVMLQILAALLFGLVIVFGVGFASAEFAHNAAHDARHGLAFPCH